ncbi:MAG: hypothetical protein RJA25_672 [Bacteroidota bacterium]|jgi:hypothetical protein
MFRLFKYIVLFVLGYKVLKTLFAENKPTPQKSTPPPPNHQQHFQSKATSSTPIDTKYNDAELIDYEEIK